jgi:adenosylmethionine-8-amino-7-oxononanoate aminotransferase
MTSRELHRRHVMAQDHKGTTGKTAAELRQTALDHLWAQSQQWDDLVAEGGPLIIEEGKGVKLKDIDGKWYYDGSSGASLVNIGHGRQELVEAAQKQMASVSYATIFSSATIPTIELAEKVASLTPGDLNHLLISNDTHHRACGEGSLSHARRFKPCGVY